MKTVARITIFLSVAYLAAGCNSSEQQTDPIPLTRPDSLATTSPIKSSNPNGEVLQPAFGFNLPVPDSLTVVGEGIWVRDEPFTGEVVMKLNQGDRCKVLSRGTIGEIGGKADYWYQIRFEGKEGWLFGSQTKENIAGGPSGKTLPEAWENLRMEKKKICEVISEEYPDYGTAWKDQGKDKLDYQIWEEGWTTAYHAEYLPDTLDGFCLIPMAVSSDIGGGPQWNASLVAIKNGDWHFFPEIEGEKVAATTLEDDRYLLLMYSWTDMAYQMGNRTVDAWVFDGEKHNLRRIQQLWAEDYQVLGDSSDPDPPEGYNPEAGNRLVSATFKQKNKPLELVLDFSESGAETWRWDEKTLRFAKK